MERISSAPRLSFSNQDVFNLRNHDLSKFSKSSPGIYNPQRKGLNLSQQTINIIAATPPKSILVKSRESIPEKITQDEKEDRLSYYSIRLELQFTAFVLFCFMLTIVIPSSMIVIGFIYLYSCTAEPMIPIFLIVGGFTFISSILLLRKLKKVAKESFEDETCFKRFFMATVLFHIGWFITGCYWTYGAFEPVFEDIDSPLYCNKVLYLYSFWFLNSIFLTLSLFAVLFTIYIMFGREPNEESGEKV
ncbi:hypothetical protein JTE90_010477 [Oedothorax gibbosus]|uniref:Uncharacterized protein n=1 Tax=Oedothorax gibbosus TaxID=931172 RepID=A0AAV6W2L0_9ARAC|nr:hypothetical protein JTE90_010477 [Oedothorax gibbosus]